MDSRTQQLEALAASLDVTEFDLLLVGDGSGQTLWDPCGWHCTAYDRRTGEVAEFFGGASGGTNNYAELAPYVHALWAYHTGTYGNDGSTPRAPVRVAVVSDSEVTVRCGNGEYARRANASLWAAVNWFEQNNYRIHWTHVRRNTNDFSAKSDKVAGRVRVELGRLAEARSPAAHP
jgi:ribonuclease HI